MDDEIQKKWVVLHCLQDDSHVLLDESQIICALDEPTVDEDVRFHYPGVKPLLIGKVKAISEDYDAMKKVQNTLNAQKPAREPSFHKERPRRASGKLKEAGGFRPLVGLPSVSQSTKRKASPAATSTPSASSRKQKVQDPTVVQPTDTDESSTTSSSSSSDSSTGTPARATGDNGKQAKMLPTNVNNTKKNGCKEASKNIPTSVTPVMASGKDQNSYKAQHPKQSLLLRNASSGGSCASVDFSQKAGPLNRVDGSKSSTSNDRTFREQSDKSDSESSMDEAEKALLQKMAQKKKYRDFTQLVQLNKHKQKEVSDQGHEQPNLHSFQGEKHDFDLGGNISDDQSNRSGGGVESHSGDEGGQDGNDKGKEHAGMGTSELTQNAKRGDKEYQGDDVKEGSTVSPGDKRGPEPSFVRIVTSNQKLVPKNRKPISREREVKEFIFEGSMYKYSSDTKDCKVEEIITDSDVWVSSAEFREIKKRWTSASALARSLTRKIFTDEALITCSCQGRVHFFKDGNAEKRTPLHKDGVNAILDFVKKRCEKKKWPCPQDSILRQSINNMLREERYGKALQGEDIDQDPPTGHQQ